MKLVLATPLFPPDSGGPATDAALLAKELPKHGIETVVCSFGKVRHLPSGIRHVAYAFEVWKEARRADGIVAFDTFSACLPAAWVARVLRKPLIIRVPGDFAWEQATQRFGVTDSIEVFQTKRYGFRVEMTRWLQSSAARRAALLVVPSNYLRGIVAQWGVRPERLMRIYLGIDFSEEPIMPTDVPDGKILFTLGRLVPWKGFAMLIDLMHELPKEWHLVIAGDGPLRGELEKQADAIGIADRITFTGALPRAEILGWYRAADAFALNTSFESFSFQVLEAMASGTPVIATNIGSLPELITNGVEGVLCTPNDSEAFKEAILSTQSEAGAWQTQTDDAVRKARGFSVETSVHAFADAVTKLCG